MQFTCVFFKLTAAAPHISFREVFHAATVAKRCVPQEAGNRFQKLNIIFNTFKRHTLSRKKESLMKEPLKLPKSLLQQVLSGVFA